MKYVFFLACISLLPLNGIAQSALPRSVDSLSAVRRKIDEDRKLDSQHKKYPSSGTDTFLFSTLGRGNPIESSTKPTKADTVRVKPKNSN